MMEFLRGCTAVINQIFQAELDHRQQTWQFLPPNSDVKAETQTTKDNLKSIEPYLVDLVKIASHLRMDKNDTLELEARLGRFDAVSGCFRPGVSKEFMDACLEAFSSWDGWQEVTPWVHTVDTFYEWSKQEYRTTTDFTADPPQIEHVVKKKLAYVDLITQADVSHAFRDGRELYDVRVALARERQVGPPAVHLVAPSHVRMKIRKSFRYQPQGTSRPFWSFDFTISWGGAHIIEADQRQAEADGTRHEIEVECANPHVYLQAASCTASYLVASLILKVKNDLLRCGGDVAKRGMGLGGVGLGGVGMNAMGLGGGGLNAMGLDGMADAHPPSNIYFRIVQVKTYVELPK